MRLVSLVSALLITGWAEFGVAQEPPLPVDEEARDGDIGFRLGQNYPNPLNAQTRTRIPFELLEPLFATGEPVTVSIRIFNILQQYVAAPVALGFAGGEGLPMMQLEYTSPGRYEAYWDVRDRNGNQVASGVYFVQMLVNGQATLRKMFVTR